MSLGCCCSCVAFLASRLCFGGLSVEPGAWGGLGESADGQCDIESPCGGRTQQCHGEPTMCENVVSLKGGSYGCGSCSQRSRDLGRSYICGRMGHPSPPLPSSPHDNHRCITGVCVVRWREMRQFEPEWCGSNGH